MLDGSCHLDIAMLSTGYCGFAACYLFLCAAHQLRYGMVNVLALNLAFQVYWKCLKNTFSDFSAIHNEAAMLVPPAHQHPKQCSAIHTHAHQWNWPSWAMWGMCEDTLSCSQEPGDWTYNLMFRVWPTPTPEPKPPQGFLESLCGVHQDFTDEQNIWTDVLVTCFSC